MFVRAFEENNCTRFKKIDTVKDFLDRISLLNEDFKDLIYDGKKIVPKDQK
jgi:hypothetical protein